jgi:hypothetical protein
MAAQHNQGNRATAARSGSPAPEANPGLLGTAGPPPQATVGAGVRVEWETSGTPRAEADARAKLAVGAKK